MTIRKRIIIPMLALAIGSCAAVLVSSILLFSKEMSDAMHDKVDVAAMVVEHEIENLIANAQVAAFGMANNPNLIDALTGNNRDEIAATADALKTLSKIDYCTILDAKGNVITRTHEPNIYGDNLAHLPHVKQAMTGNSKSYVTQGVTIRLGTYAGAPVYDKNKNIIGIVSVGFRLDEQTFAYNMKTLTGCEISVFSKDERVSTTLIIDNDNTYAIGTKAASHISETVMAGERHVSKTRLFDREMLTKYAPVHGAENRVIGMTFVGFFTEDYTRKMYLFILYGTLITLAVIAICVIIARSIAKVVERELESMMDEVRKMDEATHVAIEEQKSLSKLGNIMNGLDIMVYVTDPRTNEILFMNDSMKRHYNIKGDCVGQTCYKVLQDGISERCNFCPCNQLDQNPEETISWEEHSTLTDRIYHNVDRYIDWPNGHKAHMQHSVDITDLVAAKEAAEQNSRYKSAFLANMSHEIRTPMNAILGIAEIQLRDEKLSPTTEDALSKIYESGDLLLNIINDILDLSKIEAGKLELNPARYDVPSLINDTVQLNRLRYESKPVQLIIEVDENTPLDLFGDELRIKQVLNNILSNAFKYTNEGTIKFSVTSKKRNTPDGNVDIVFCVSDTGQGMSEEQLDKLFNEYTRFNTQANRTTAGAGLGMNIAKHLVDMMHGNISVESEPDKGTVFTVCIPQKREGETICGAKLAEKLRNSSFQSTSIVKKTQFLREYMPYGSVLVVDDVESNIYVAKGMMKPYGLKIDTATSGFEAIDKIKNGNVYDIVFMDHMMPKMDGMEATKIMREMGYKHNIIALTANALTGQKEKFLQNGFDDFISKPLDSRELNLMLNDYIRNKKPPEVVEAARRERSEKELKSTDSTVLEMTNTTELKTFFVRDAENAVKTLENMRGRINNLNSDEIETYTTTVHGMKSALANIGEKEWSEMALKLEQAGKKRNHEIIANDTPAFIDAIRAIIAKHKPEENNEAGTTEITGEDEGYLKERLTVIKAACADFDINSANAALDDLKKKTWPNNISRVLEEITVHLLHSEFDEAERKTANI